MVQTRSTRARLRERNSASSNDEHDTLLAVEPSGGKQQLFKSKTSSGAAAELNNEAPAASDLGFIGQLRAEGDLASFALLLVLYTLQGIPMGLGGSIPLLLQSKNVSYADQGVFSLVSWPFSLKLLWAPIVDALYSESFGRRKSWLVPIQLLCGVVMIAISAQVDGMISADPVDVKTLTAVFFFLYFLMATQDIAVDGWALTMLSEKNVGYASTANSVGQTFGYFGAYIIFMALNSASFCNNYLRSIPEDAGLIELSDFLWFWGWVFVVVTLVVWWLKAERKDTDTQQSVWATYKQMLQIITRKNVLNLSFMLLTTKIALAGPESIATLKLVEGGVPKEHLAFMGALLAPFGIFIPILIGKYTSGPRPLSVFMHGYLPRVAIIGVTALIVWQTPVIEDGEVPYGFYAICFGFSLIGTFASNLMFVSQMALFARVSDPAIGGTYMTLLNTVANLGTKWPQTVSMFLVDPLTIKDCVDVAVTTAEGGESVTEECVTVVDGYYIICATCTVIGVIWYTYFNNRVQALERKELHTWRLQ